MGTIGESQGIVLWILGLAATELLPSLGPRGRGKGEATGNWKGSKYCRAGDLEKYSNVLWRAMATAPQGRKRPSFSSLPFFSSVGSPIGQTQKEA